MVCVCVCTGRRAAKVTVTLKECQSFQSTQATATTKSLSNIPNNSLQHVPHKTASCEVKHSGCNCMTIKQLLPPLNSRQQIPANPGTLLSNPHLQTLPGNSCMILEDFRNLGSNSLRTNLTKPSLRTWDPCGNLKLVTAVLEKFA